MVEINVYKPIVESIAPNQDAVKEGVNPFKGLLDVSAGLEQTAKVLDQLSFESQYSEASTQYTQLSASFGDRFLTYSNSLPIDDTPNMSKKINAFVDRELRGDSEKFLSKIGDKATRRHFRAHAENDLLNYKKKGLELQIGAMVKAQQTNLNISLTNAVDTLAHDPSNENRKKQLGLLSDHVNSLPIDIEKKQLFLNQHREEINKAQIISAHARNPHLFENSLSVVIKDASKPKDPHSLAELVDSAGARELEVNADVSQNIKEIDGWKELDPTVRRALIRDLVTTDNRRNAQKRAELTKRVKAIDTLLDKGIVTPEAQKITSDEAIDVYGVDRGVELKGLLDFKVNFAPNIMALKTMTPSEAESFLEILKDKITESTHSPEAMLKYNTFYTRQAEVHKKSMDLLRQDPHEWAVQNKGLKHLNFDDLSKLGGAISERVTILKDIDKKFGTTIPLFSKKDEGSLLTKLQNSNSQKFIEDMIFVWKEANEGDKDKIQYSYEKTENPMLSGIFQATVSDDPIIRESAVLIATGGKHRLDIEKNFKNLNEYDFKDAYGLKIRKHVGEYYSNGESILDDAGKRLAMEKEAQGIEMYILGDMHRTGNYSVKEVNERLGKALEATVGGLSPISINGCKLRPTRGISIEDYQDILHASTQFTLEKMGREGKELLPEFYGYANIGRGRVMLMSNRVPVKDDQGNTIILDVKNPPSEIIHEMVRQKRKQQKQYIELMHSLISNELP